MNILKLLRTATYNQVALKQLNSDFIFNNFNLQQTHLPFSELKTLKSTHPQGILYIIGLGFSDLLNKSRKDMTTNEQPIQLAYQRAVDVTDLDLLDDCTQLVGELFTMLRTEVRLDLPGFVWNRTEFLRDETNTPFNFAGLRERGVFEAYFTAYYHTTIA